MRHHLGITHRILRMGFLLNWLGKVLAKTRVYKKEHRWAWEMIQEVWSSRESLLYLQLMATVKVSNTVCYKNYSSAPNLDYNTGKSQLCTGGDRGPRLPDVELDSGFGRIVKASDM